MSEDHRIRRKSSADAERSSLIVLGMHRSGTSAITGALNVCGAWVGEEEELTAANEENPRGFWERRDIRRICDRLLHASEADWWKIGSFDPNAIPPDVMRQERTRFASIVSRLDEHGTWAIKEPRLCFLLPVLRDHITNPVCIHIFRNPLEVAQSLQVRNGFDVAAGLALWETYNRHALSASENLPRVLISYEALALRPMETIGRLLASLAEFGETSLVKPDADQLGQFIDPSLYRRRADEEETREYLSPSQLDLWHQYCAGQVFDHEGSATIPRATGHHLVDFETAQTSLDQQRQRERERELLTELSARNREVADLQRQTAALISERNENNATIQAQETTIKAHETTIKARGAIIEARDATIRNLLSSTSWKLTAPLRSLSRAFTWSRQSSRRALKLAYRLVKGGASRFRGCFHLSTAPGPRDVRTKSGITFPRDLNKLSEIVRESQKRQSATRSRNTATVAQNKTAKVSIIAWNMGHNPLGRAYLIADLLRSDYDVEIVGALFPQFGTKLWRPLRSCSRVTMKCFPGSEFPKHFTSMEDVAKRIDGDILYVSKPRLPSVELAILAKSHRNRPIILDIDDYELSFFKNTDRLALEEATSNQRHRDYNKPQAETWTRYCESLIPLFDHITVSNEELQKKYGGRILPHLRSEHDFDPAAYPRHEIRAALGFRPEDKVVLFAGTVRMHKGVSLLGHAVTKLRHLNCKLLLVGSAPDPETRHFLRAIEGTHATVIPDVPFHDLPGYLRAGDLVCLLQDPDNVTSQFQMPAKFTDALAMGIPVVASNAGPLQSLARQRLVEPLGSTSLEEKIEEIFLNYGVYKKRARENREHFVSHYSYGACRPWLTGMLDSLLEASPSPMPGDFLDLIETHRRLFNVSCESPGRPIPDLTVHLPVSESMSATESSPLPCPLDRFDAPRKRQNRVFQDDKIDIVFFWKQNDTGIYGRRQDMLVKYLAKDPRIYRIFHFDAPINLLRVVGDACRAAGPHSHSHAKLVLLNTLRRRYFRERWTKVRFDTFTFFASSSATRLTKFFFSSENDYPKYLEDIFARHGVGERRVVFWVCPNNFQFPDLERKFEPDLVVADVIDDQRTWETPPAHRDRLQANYHEILGRSDLVFVNCETVFQNMQEFANNIHLFPNAAETFQPGAHAWRKPVELTRMKGPIIGYVGNLDIARIDLELLETVAAREPGWNLVFIGSMHRGKEIEGLRRFGNVHFLGVRAYERALQYIKCFDVAMIPHLDNELTRSMNPLKLYVYLSLHVPVVATPIHNLGGFGEFVRIGRTPEQFIRVVREALEVSPDTEIFARLEQLLTAHSWSTRVTGMIKLIEAEFARATSSVNEQERME